MTLINSDICEWLNGHGPDAETVEALKREMPWWLLPAAMRLRNCADELSDGERTALANRLALNASDLEQMSMAVNTSLAIDLAQFYPVERPQTPGTDETIEKFINTYGPGQSDEESAILERLIFNPVPDYAQLLAREEEASTPQPDEAADGTPDALINSFIIKSKAAGGQFPAAHAEAESEEPVRPQSEVRKPAESDDTMLSESLAQVYIKRGNFSKAYEIISHLNLNFPEKSIYFADQLRFLSKLIALEERKSASNK